MVGCIWLKKSDKLEFQKLVPWLNCTVHFPPEAFVGLLDKQSEEKFFCFRLGSSKTCIRAHNGEGHTISHHITSQHITLHHSTAHHITSHHITAHHITSHQGSGRPLWLSCKSTTLDPPETSFLESRQVDEYVAKGLLFPFGKSCGCSVVNQTTNTMSPRTFPVRTRPRKEPILKAIPAILGPKGWRHNQKKRSRDLI